MASEVNGGVNLTANKNGAAVSRQYSATLDMMGTRMKQNVQTIPTAWTLLNWGDIAGTPSAFTIANLDDVNFVELALDNAGTQKIAKLPARGIPNLITPSGTNIYARANAAAVDVEIVATEA